MKAIAAALLAHLFFKYGRQCNEEGSQGFPGFFFLLSIAFGCAATFLLVASE